MQRHGKLTRRQLLSAGKVALFGLSLPQFLAAQQGEPQQVVDTSSFGRAKACILLFMWGGPAHQDTWDLKPQAPREVRGEFNPISTDVPGIQICEHFPQLSQRCKDLSIIRSMTHNNVNHTTATHFLLTGQAPPPFDDLSRDWPSLGSVLSKLGRGRAPLPPFVSMRPKLENTVPRFVEQSHGQFAGWLGSSFDPLTIDADPSREDYKVGDFELQPEINVSRLDRRVELLEQLEPRQAEVNQRGTTTAMSSHYDRAFELLHSAVGQDAFDVSREPEEVRERYGKNPHGQSVLQARRLVERGVPLVTVFWPNDGIKNVSVYWDTHSRNFIDLKERLMPVADQAFSALIDDLKERGMFDDTLVVWTGEFGRTPKVGQRNSDAGAGADGRDHWPNCFTSVLAGGGIRGGQTYGTSDRYAAYPASDAMQPVDLMATVHHLLGIPHHLTLQDNQGRPLVVCPGTVIERLFG
ncbi:MAG: DUF1501 domain-containing protein [Planctomycetaceae bacterium]|nr:DUF1501 domain-containing protein [Planctomycetaceae bacterium]